MCITESKNYIDFSFTQDGSVGLYNRRVEDVYHSVFGALSEAEEKFVAPLNLSGNYLHKKNIKVLDICYGIGYNTKAFLKKILQTKYKGKVYIDILEYDKKLVTISPFIKDNLFKKYPEVSYILLANLLNEIIEDKATLKDILLKSDNKKFIEPFYRSLIKNKYFLRYSYNPLGQNNSFLHNIYYHCISQRNKKPLKCLKMHNFIIKPYFDDARNTIKSINNKYDIIFLDAFTPAKLPTLWSYEFFKELYRLSDVNATLVTYSNSAAVRHAMLEAGFFAGKLFDKQHRHCGTIASPNNNLILNKLDEYDTGLINTKAGIYYKDANLNLTAKEIIDLYNKEKSESNLQTPSQYIKKYKTENL